MKQLIDISALASCFKEYGAHPLHYLYRLIMPAESSAYNLLGNTVNTMFDSIVSHPDVPASQQLHDVLQQAWHDDALLFLSADDDALQRRYFQVIGQQYQNVRQVVDFDFPSQGIEARRAWLEPSFVCPELGLSGRMDLLDLGGFQPEGEVGGSQLLCKEACDEQQSALQAHIVELKSGKMNEWQHQSKQAHRVQTMLYAEVLQRCLSIPASHIISHLHYNTYPLLKTEHFTPDFTQRVMEFKLEVTRLLHEVAEGNGRHYFTRQTVEQMYPGQESKLWTAHDLPQLLKFVSTIEDAPEPQREWFFSRLQFIMREEELHLQQPVPVSLRQLRLKELQVAEDSADVIGLKLSLGGDEEHDFRVGDPVIIYHLHTPQTQASDAIVMRGCLADVSDEGLTFRFRHSERICHFEPLLHEPFALEHDNVNSSISQACRSLFLTLKQGGPQLRQCRLIVGPPGTGKTSVTLRNLILQLQQDNQQRVLLMAFTHRAVDEICQTLEGALSASPTDGTASSLPYLRLGTIADTPAEYQPRLLQNLIDRCPDRQTLRQSIMQTCFWTGTTARLQATRQLFDLLQFDTIIVDEASQLLDFQCIDLLKQATREVILIGDPKQLPAVTLQPGAQSLFEQLYRQGTPATLLDHQGRMHPEIAQFSNRMFYGGRLQPVGLPHQLEEESLMPRCWFFDVPSPPLGTKANPAEARMVARLVKRVSQIYASQQWVWHDHTLGIIVPYRQQIAAIRRELESPPYHTPHTGLINIDTVERYQGSQRDVIIYTTTVSTSAQLEQLSTPIELDSQLIDRKLNVAITRARKHLFIIGNAKLLCQSAVYQDLLSQMSDKMSTHV